MSKKTDSLAVFQGLGIILTNNEIKDIIKAINSLENTGILLKGTIKKNTSQKGGFLNFLGPLIKTGLPLMRCIRSWSGILMLPHPLTNLEI